MRRPTLNNLPLPWWGIVGLIAAFALGAVFDNRAVPLISRDVTVMEINGKKGEGCEGSLGMSYVRFGRPHGQADGTYSASCDELIHPSDTVALLCRCV